MSRSRLVYLYIAMSLKVAEIKGIPIKLHFTLLLVFFLVSWTLATGFMPQLYPGLAAGQYWTMGLVGAVVLFASVLLHELSHSIVAIRFGIRVRQIILFVFGGVSDIEEEPRDFGREFKIAFAGPATSFALSGIFAALWWAASALSMEGEAGGSPAAAAATMVEGILFYAATVNVLLGAFNLIPAFPMDGGRILRSLLVRRNKGDYDRATRTAARVGIAISYAFFGIGFLVILTGSFISGIWMLLIGWFIQSGAQSYLQQHDVMSILSNIRLGDVMNTRVVSVPAGTPVDIALRDYFKVHMKSSLPVTDPDDGRLVGLVTLKAALAAPSTSATPAAGAPVDAVMTPREELVILGPESRLDEALKLMARKETGGKVFVCDAAGRLVGLASKTDILDAAGERMEFLAHTRQQQQQQQQQQKAPG